MSLTEVIQHTAAMIELHAIQGKRWSSVAREPEAERTLTDAVLVRLAALRLVRRVHHRDVVEIFPLPAIHRFALVAPGSEAAAPRKAARRARR